MTIPRFTLGFIVFIIFCGLLFFFSPKVKSQDNAVPSRLVSPPAVKHNPLRAAQGAEFIPRGAKAAPNIRQTALDTESAPADLDDFPLIKPSETAPNHTPKPLPPNNSPLDFADPFAAPQKQTATSENFENPPVPEGMLDIHVEETKVPVPRSALPSANSVQEEGTAFYQSASVLPSTHSVQEEGTGVPGAASLEGEQNAHIVLQKIFPEEVVVGQALVIKTVIQNTGKAAARNVLVTDKIPQGTQLQSTSPQAAGGEQGTLLWSLGDINANDKIVLEMKVLPLREGEIGSVASVSYSNEVSGRISVTRPMLKVEVKAPAEVRLGQTAQVEIIISNPGTATVTGIVLEEHIPEGLYHHDGRVLVNRNIKVLKPKEAKKLILPLVCNGAGNLVNEVIVKADGGLTAEDKTTIRACAPVLQLQITGAKQRFLDLQSDYKLAIANTGNDSAQNVDLTLSLPPSVKFVKTNQSGVYNPNTHSVHWALEELPAQESGEIELTILPTQVGEQKLTFTGKGQNNLQAQTVMPVTVDGLPALSFEIVGGSNLVEAGKNATYEIRVVNKGTKAANNVKVAAHLAQGMTLVKAEGGKYQANEGTVQYEPIAVLEPKGEKTFTVAARCADGGDYRFSVQIISDDLLSPITKEESTRVYR